MGKGGDVERKTQRAYERAGYWCYRPPDVRYQDTDMWNLFDIAAFHPGHRELRLVQVKANETQGELTEWCGKAKHFARVSGIQAEFVVRYDNEGYRVMKPGLTSRASYINAVDTREWDVSPPDNADLSGIDEALAMWLRGESPDGGGVY